MRDSEFRPPPGNRARAPVIRPFLEEELRQEFMAFGEVVSAGTIKAKGFGFVEMSSRAEGQAAIDSLRGKTLKGKMLDINEDEGARRPGR